MASSTNFSPIRLPTRRPASGKDLNRVQDQIVGPVKRLSSAVASIKLPPAVSVVQAGTATVTLQTTAPQTMETTPSVWAQFTVNGKTYTFPVLRVK